MGTRSIVSFTYILFFANVDFEFAEDSGLDCNWTAACGGSVNVRNSGQGCIEPSLGQTSQCEICNFIYNSPPCDNTAENVYKHRERLYSDSPHYQYICGGSSGSQDASYEENPWDDPDISCGPICAASGRPPFRSITLLDTCYRYSELTCCYVNQDVEIGDAYFTLIDAGDRCEQELTFPKLKLRDAFCMACDPRQGSFLVEGKLKV